jgi:hypothetical protein
MSLLAKKLSAATSDPSSDPFGESTSTGARKRLQLLGGRFEFESNSDQLMRLVDSAYADLPAHRLSAAAPTFRVKLLLGSHMRSPSRVEPPPLTMLCGPGFVGGATDASNLVVVSPLERTALIVVSPQMIRFPYHTRYEMIEFAVFTLATRSLGLVPLHAACVSRGGSCVLMMGSSGAGKSTVALHCLLQGLEFVAEDGVFVAPDTMLATGVANFLHVRSDSLRWLERPRDIAAIRSSPVIRRRSGVKKYEVDLRRRGYRLAAHPPKITAVVFLSPQRAGKGSLLRPVRTSDMRKKLAENQAYAANQPGWGAFVRNASRLNAFELRRGRHPLEAVEVLQTLLGSQ